MEQKKPSLKFNNTGDAYKDFYNFLRENKNKKFTFIDLRTLSGYSESQTKTELRNLVIRRLIVKGKEDVFSMRYIYYNDDKCEKFDDE